MVEDTSRKRWSWKVWMNITVALLGLLGGILAASLQDPVLVAAPAAAFVFLSFSLPVSQWGWPGLFLTFGLVFAVSGTILWSVGSIGEEIVDELEKDNDGDGRVDEDPPGDGDGSASDPREADGAEELQDPDDDDSDGKVDEDPPEPPGARTVARGVGTLGRGLGLIGGLLMALFGYLVWQRGRGPASSTDDRPPDGVPGGRQG